MYLLFQEISIGPITVRKEHLLTRFDRLYVVVYKDEICVGIVSSVPSIIVNLSEVLSIRNEFHVFLIEILSNIVIVVKDFVHYVESLLRCLLIKLFIRFVVVLIDVISVAECAFVLEHVNSS